MTNACLWVLYKQPLKEKAPRLTRGAFSFNGAVTALNILLSLASVKPRRFLERHCINLAFLEKRCSLGCLAVDHEIARSIWSVWREVLPNAIILETSGQIDSAMIGVFFVNVDQGAFHLAGNFA
jgi:hypothetical protein